MAKGLPRRFFDSDAIIHFINGEPDAGPVVGALMEEASAGQWTLVVSAVTMLEVTRQKSKPVDPTKYAKIMSFFENPYVFVRELDILLAEKAQKLIYYYLWLHPNDAAHLAAAIDTGCEVFYTYDEELINRFDGEQGLRVQRPEMPKKTDLTDLPLFQQSATPSCGPRRDT